MTLCFVNVMKIRSTLILSFSRREKGRLNYPLGLRGGASSHGLCG